MVCIWQSMNHEDTDPLIGRKNSATSAPSVLQGGDRLRDFCAEVIIPFYATRLPEVASSICKKLGAPVAPSPGQSLKKTNMIHPACHKPGAPIDRSEFYEKKASLDQTTTDDKPVRRKTATLTRSATESALPEIKRELREVSLSLIPQSRPPLRQSQQYRRREIDLTAVSQATEAKLQKKAAIEQELKGAIAALKKPNPRMAVKEFVDSADLRMESMGSKPRKAKNPIRNPFASGVQVMATPKGNRHRDVYYAHNTTTQATATIVEVPHVIPPSSDPRVPSSSIRPKMSVFTKPTLPAGTPKRTLKRANTLPVAVNQTPSRRESRISQASTLFGIEDDCEDDKLLMSPELPRIKPEHQTVLQAPSPRADISFLLAHDTPSKSRRQAEQYGQSVIYKSKSFSHNDNETERRAISQDEHSKTLPVSNTPMTKDQDQESEHREASIYDALGWNDDIDDL